MKSSPEPSDIWKIIDAVIVINLDTRPDRWEWFCKLNKGKVPPEKLHRLSAVNGRELPSFGKEPWFTARTGERARQWGGVGGCILSHRNALRMVVENGWRNALIVEDDVSLPESATARSELAGALGQLSGAWFLYLGYGNSRPYARNLGGNLWRSEGVLGTFAYMASREACEAVLPHLPTDDELWRWVSRYRAIDTWYADYMPYVTRVRVHVLNPTIVEHLDMGSDIATGSCDASSFLSASSPHPRGSLGGFLHLLAHPFRRLKVRLNSLRTLRRATKGGLPGFRRR